MYQKCKEDGKVHIMKQHIIDNIEIKQKEDNSSGLTLCGLVANCNGLEEKTYLYLTQIDCKEITCKKCLEKYQQEVNKL